MAIDHSIDFLSDDKHWSMVEKYAFTDILSEAIACWLITYINTQKRHVVVYSSQYQFTHCLCIEETLHKFIESSRSTAFLPRRKQ